MYYVTPSQRTAAFENGYNRIQNPLVSNASHERYWTKIKLTNKHVHH